MNAAHLHLILNHVPVLGVVFGMALLGIGLLRENRLLQQTGLIVLVAAAVAAAGAFLTGREAEDIVEDRLRNVDSFIHSHEDNALFALVAAGLTGLLSVVALWLGRGARVLSRGLLRLTFAMAVVASLLMVWVANLGGRISHPEARPGDQVSAEAPRGDADEDR
jgi:hypothetical protein